MGTRIQPTRVMGGYIWKPQGQVNPKVLSSPEPLGVENSEPASSLCGLHALPALAHFMGITETCCVRLAWSPGLSAPPGASRALGSFLVHR